MQTFSFNDQLQCGLNFEKKKIHYHRCCKQAKKFIFMRFNTAIKDFPWIKMIKFAMILNLGQYDAAREKKNLSTPLSKW